MKRLAAACALALSSVCALAQMTPVGLWKTIDDDGKTEKSWVRIAESGGVLTGTIEKILDPAKLDSKCDKCSDERRDKPVQGLTIIRNVRQDGDDKAMWDGGDILDPKDGKVYKTRLKLAVSGKKLEVRGYIGAPLFGRTQVWQRIE